MALLGLEFADEPQHYNCLTCPKNVAKRRRCADERMDFTSDDAAFWPIYLNRDAKGQVSGTGFGFCPGKATWYHHHQKLFRQLVLAAETGTPLFAGGLMDQPEWAAELTSWFVPEYLERQFMRRAARIFGSGKDDKATVTPPKK